MIIQVKRGNNVILPTQATENSAGYDIVAISDPKIVGDKLEDKFFTADEPKTEWWRFVSYIEYETGLYISPEDKDVHTLIYPRSSISSKTNLMLANSIGLIDFDYRGQLICRFRYMWQPFDMAWLHIKNHSDENNPLVPMLLGNINPDRIYKRGDTIAQLVFSRTINANFQFVDELDKTARGQGGFGSTDQQQSSMHPTQTGIAGTLTDLYQQTGGIQTKKRYIDQVKEHDGRLTSRPPSGQVMPQKTEVVERR